MPSDSRNFTLETVATEYPSFLTIEKSHVVACVHNVYFLYTSIVFGTTLVVEDVAFTFKTVVSVGINIWRIIYWMLIDLNMFLRLQN